MLQGRFVHQHETQQDGWWRVKDVQPGVFAQFLEDAGVIGRER